MPTKNGAKLRIFLHNALPRPKKSFNYLAFKKKKSNLHSANYAGPMKQHLFIRLTICIAAFFILQFVWADSTPDQSPKTLTGKASWYNAHGRFTANGERFHKDSLTCAHRTFPFGTKLKVRNIKNGREVIVRVTDRGPFGNKYCIDISIAAARILGIVRMGFAEVEITEYEETIVPLKAGPVKIPGLGFGTVNVDKDYTPEWKPETLPPLKPL